MTKWNKGTDEKQSITPRIILVLKSFCCPFSSIFLGSVGRYFFIFTYFRDSARSLNKGWRGVIKEFYHFAHVLKQIICLKDSWNDRFVPHWNQCENFERNTKTFFWKFEKNRLGRERATQTFSLIGLLSFF